ncbi:protein kinase domain-containing protein [Marinobacter sp. JSM 1782161]|uniref:protein kinase domain-containing protein n=1 Tax=Marinobacter sp. JSM 1782161 TaxID=2685906 RepID=UPI001403FFFB|nr:protein kinase [Marinobacter sp. JSM 1782161]
MKPFDHSEFEHERRAFAELEQRLPVSEHYELYPSIHITDPGRRMYECDALFISESFAAVIELKDWRGEIEVKPNFWFRGGEAKRNPHEVNLPKAKVFRSLNEKQLPAARPPFVQSIVVLTSENSSVEGADSAHEIIRQLDQHKRLPDHLTFVGMAELAKYLRVRVNRDQANDRATLSFQSFRKLRNYWDKTFEVSRQRDDYADQIPGYRVLHEVEHNERYVSYLAEANPKRGDALYRLRVFGLAAETPEEQERQFRSFDVLQHLPHHPNIRPVHRQPNEKGLVVEVCPWGDARTLDQVLASNESVSSDFAVRVVRDIAGALVHLHDSEATLVHRNVTPRSIIVGRDDHVELTDFDLAFDPLAEYTVMGGGFSDYEKRYFPPEALAGETDFGFDVYSLGKTFGELLDKTTGEEIVELRELFQRMTVVDFSNRPKAKVVFSELSEWLGDSAHEPSEAIPREEQKAPEVGDSHNTWSLVDRLGCGGTSDVFLGDSLGVLAALKIFNADVPREKVLAERDYLRAAKQNRFVADYSSFLQWNNTYWCIVEEYVEGATLKSLIASGERPDPAAFVTVADQILQALAGLHEPGRDDDEDVLRVAITHNDVTPGNIVFNANKQFAKLIDFGMASSIGKKVLGATPGYAARALMTKEGYLASPAGDLYSLAVTLVEWATGKRPASADDVPRLLESGLKSDQADRLQRALQSMLEIQDDSTVSASTVRRAFTSLLCEEDEQAEVMEPVESIPADEPTPLSAGAETAYEGAARHDGAEAADGFVRYLNSIHNISADNRYALAEAQATSPYFTELHVELDLVSSIRELLTGQSDVVVVLTGHAGDGKSTVALDVWKRALEIPDTEPAAKSPEEEEIVTLDGHKLTIVKDMSELSAQSRTEKLTNAFSQSGSALIVSNTGPLLSSFTELMAKEGHGDREAQQKILECLNQPLLKDKLTDANLLNLDGKKRVYVANLSMLSNVNTAERLLSKLVSHSGWEKCRSCKAKDRCPIRRNVDVMSECASTVGERVGDIYRRLDAYGRRMTMRQIAAHLSFSLTGGLSCGQVRQDPQTTFRGVFSENFFGHGSAFSLQAADALSCLRQMADLHFGIAASPTFDHQLHEGKLGVVWNYPSQLSELKTHFASRLDSSEGGSARRKIRRLTYMFGTPREEHQGAVEVFFDDFLQSPMLRKLREWQANHTLAGMEKQRFLKQVLGVLIEEYIGASVPRNRRDSLFITLRRPDEKVFQSVQIVLGKISLDEFTVELDRVSGLPVLTYGSTKARLALPLPLLDYIISKDQGELTSDLDAIHGASLEQFRSDLLEHIPHKSDTVELLEIDAQGDLRTHKFTPINGGQKLVYQ